MILYESTQKGISHPYDLKRNFPPPLYKDKSEKLCLGTHAKATAVCHHTLFYYHKKWR